jgi:fatty-acyl-CoA synthase
MTIAYGLTEASPGITHTRRDDSLVNRTQTVGKVLPEMEVRIVDPATREEVPTGAPGELCVRGYNVMLGYYNNPDATRAAIDKNGWLRTGDQATIDADGYVRITGRIKDLIIRGGENISAAEVEAECYACVSVAEAAVFGAPDERLGEVPVAVIHVKNGEELGAEDLLAFLDGKLARFKIPERIIISSEPLPRLGTGKIDRRALKAQYAR